MQSIITLLSVVVAGSGTAGRRAASARAVVGRPRPRPPSGGRSCAAGRRRRSRAGSAARRRSPGRRSTRRRPRRRAAEEDEGADHPRVDRPDPAGANGIRLATMPTKKPWTTTRERDRRRRRPGSAPRGSRCCAAQKPTAPSDREPAARRVRGRSRARSRVPLASGRRDAWRAGATAARRSALRRSAAMRRSRSSGTSAISRKTSDHAAGDRRRDDRQPDGAVAARTPGAQQDPEDRPARAGRRRRGGRGRRPSGGPSAVRGIPALRSAQ